MHDQVIQARKEKLPTQLKLVRPDARIDLAQLTEAYIAEGMACISTKGRMKKEKRKKVGAREQRNRAAYEKMNRLCFEEPEVAAVASTEAPAPATAQEVPS